MEYDDLLDLVNAVEMLMLKLTGKILRKEFRPAITDRDALKITDLRAGDYSLYDESEGPAAQEPEQTCNVTEDVLKTHYMRVEIGGTVWHNWFCRLDELIKCLYIIAREAQAQDVPHGTFSHRAPKQTVNLSPGVLNG